MGDGLKSFLRRLGAVFRRGRLERDLDDELAFHLAMRQEEQARLGKGPNQAALDSRRQFGSVLRVSEQARDAWMVAWIDAIHQDLRHGWRSLRRSPGFLAVAVITLSCGIAVANTTFAIVNAPLVRGVPFERPERLVHLGFKAPRSEYGNVSLLEYRDLQALRSLRLAAYDNAPMTLGEDSRAPERLEGTYVSAQGLELIGIQPVLGRTFLSEDDRPGAPGVAILSEAVWTSRYNRDPDVLGRGVRVNGRPATIVGVVPTRYTLNATRSDIWQPLMQMPDLEAQERSVRTLSLLGASDGTALNQTQQELQALANRLRQEQPDVYKDLEAIAIPLEDRFIHPQVQQILLVVFAAGLVVLFIACANVANLLLARTANRRHEIATRVALGASRSQIWRQLLVESVLLGAASGIAALAMSHGLLRIFNAAIGATNPPVWLRFEVDGNVVIFLTAASLAGSLGSALFPAVHGARQDAHAGLQLGIRAATEGRQARRWSAALVAGEVALTLVLLSGAGLMMRAFWSLFSTDPGVATRGLTVFRLDLAGPKYAAAEQRADLHDRLAERLRAMPGLSGASVTTSVPGAGAPPQWAFQREGQAFDKDKPALVSMVAIGDDYFRALNRPVLRGRSFQEFDGTAARGVAIVNERVASMFFASDDPLGQRIRVTRSGRNAFDSGWMTIIGVSPTINQTNPLLGRGPDPVIYIPYRSQPAADAVMLASGSGTGWVVQHVRTEVLALDPELAVFDAQSLDAFLAFFRWPQRVFGTVLLVLALIALVLATVGLYAIVAYSVVRRTREIGLRVALGAQRRQILLLVLRHGAVPFSIGLILGSAGALAVGQLLTAFLMDIEPRDPVTLAAVSAALGVVGLLACLIPARRVLGLDPLAALRCE
jgi:putative ABC transport system permease protein